MANKMLVGTRKGLLIFERDGAAWSVISEHFEGVPVSYATIDHRTHTLWAALDHGHWGCKLHRSHDGGVTWEEVQAPKYPDGATRPPDDTTPANTSYIWIVQPGGEDQPNRLYVGTEPGGLFLSDDGGDTFQLVETLWNLPSRDHWFGGGRDHPGVCSIVVDPRNSNHVTIGISVGGVYETTDGCETWIHRNTGLYASYMPDPYSEFGHDPHYMLASPSNPDVLWQQNHCGVFRSTDRANTWQDVSLEKQVHFGFALALDEQDDNTAWVVPAHSDEKRIPIERALFVARTEDGGESWTELREGLPQNDAYDITFRHAMHIDRDELAFGTTAGNLYFSENRGDNWHSLMENLAVIYSVKFFD